MICNSENWEENFCLSLVMKSRSGDEECDTQDQEPLKITTYNELSYRFPRKCSVFFTVSMKCPLFGGSTV